MGAQAPSRGAMDWRGYKEGGPHEMRPLQLKEGMDRGRREGGDGNSDTGLGFCLICTERVHWFDPFGGDA